MPKNIRAYLDTQPSIAATCYIDEMAVVIGEVELAENVSVWPFACIRGDVNHIRIGKNSNVQDHAMLHVSHKKADKPEGSPLIIGEDVTIGHHVTLHGCTVGNRVLIGINTVVLDDVIIEDDVMIGAGSLVPPGKRLESGYLYMGSPVKQVRALTEKERNFLPYSAQNYVKVMKNYQHNDISTLTQENKETYYKIVNKPINEFFKNKLDRSDLWILEHKSDDIDEKNDNRLDIKRGETFIYKHIDGYKEIQLCMSVSRSGKTKHWKFSRNFDGEIPF